MSQPIKWMKDIGAHADPDWPSADPSLAAAPGGGFSLVRFQDFHSDAGPTDIENIEGSHFSAAGVWQQYVSSGGGGKNSLVAQPAIIYLPDGRLVEAWMQNSGDASGVNVYAQLGNGPRFLVAGGAGVQGGPAVAANGSGFAIAVLDGSVPGGQLLTKFYDLTGKVIGESVGPPGRDVEIAALANGTYAVVWQSGSSGIELRIHTPNGAPVTGVIDADGGAGAFDFPGVAVLADGRFALTYRDQATGMIHGRVFDADGSQGSANFTAGSGTRCKVAALDDGRLMLVYESAGDVVGQVLHANGTADGGPFMVSTKTTYVQAQPTIATLADGRVAVSWIDDWGYDPDANSTGGYPWLTIFDPRESGLTTSASSLADDWYGTRFDDTVYLGVGDDRMDAALGDDRLSGEDGRDTLFGRGGKDTLNGGADEDILDGGDDDDTLDGGVGTDTASYGSATAGVSVSLTIAGAQNTVGAGTDMLVDIENLIGSGFNDVLTGSSSNNTLAGGAGDDTLNGGTGIDTADYSAALGGGVTVNLRISPQAVGANQGIDTLLGIENITGSAQGDRLVGNSRANNLSGLAGNDTLAGGSGSDTLDGDAGIDTADYSAALGGGVRINLDVFPQAVGADQGTDTLLGIENITGSAQGDWLFGNSLANVLSGLAGNDIINGGNGTDTLNGGDGADRFIDVAGGADTFSGGAGIDTVDFRTSATAAILNFITGIHGGAALGDTLADIEKVLGSNTAADQMSGNSTQRFTFAGFAGNDTLIGGAQRDQLLGGTGDDLLDGGADRDALNGGISNDVMTGGGGGDVFVYVDAAFGRDTITDYEDGLDSFKVFSAVADDVSDFTISGNGTNSVILALIAAPANTIALNGGGPITITTADFVFY